MWKPDSFTWIDKPLLGAMARPESAEDLVWLRKQGIDVLLSLTEDPVRQDWVNAAGLLAFHVPMIDMEAPTLGQLRRSLSAINKANDREMGVAVHCGAGLGRTGVVLACFFVDRGLSPATAISHVREL